MQFKTDFNGHTTTYAYDTMNRLQSKTADPAFSQGTCASGACGATQVGFTYTATGKRKTMTDASGTTTYNYDSRDRLQSKQTPFGTLGYTYDNANNLLSITSSNLNGASVSYKYDQLNRLSTVTDNAAQLAGAVNVLTTYGYDAAGNLKSVAYPNTVTTSYSYDLLNRLTKLASTTPNSAVASYQYTLGAAGDRTSVTELSGRNVQYGYDDVYRLTSETIAGASSQNGTIGYAYQIAGETSPDVINRRQITSTVQAIPSSGTLFYDANDRTATDNYDNDGNTINTINSGGVGNIYDFENHMVQHGAVSIVYDGDGNRVSETGGGATTNYLVDTLNPTGYAQVVDELQKNNQGNFAVVRSYTWGSQLIAKLETASSIQSFYGLDGHGSVRYLTGNTGAVTDTYDYDAFGNRVVSIGSTTNNYLFAGEQFDPNLGLYYNRARYLDVRSGRFWSMDDDIYGTDEDPSSLHKYNFAQGNPVDNLDPSGNEIDEVIGAITLSMTIDAMPMLQVGAAANATNAKFGIGIEVPEPAAVTNNVLNVAVDPGHTFVYIRQLGTIVSTSMLSFGPGEPIGLGNKNRFLNGTLPGNAHWPLTGSANTWEFTINAAQASRAKQAIVDFKSHVPNYTPSSHCTSASLSIAAKAGVDLPSGIGPVIAKVAFRTFYSANVSNPYHLNQQMIHAHGNATVVDTSNFPTP